MSTSLIRIAFCIVIIMNFFHSFSQAPEMFKYQSIARDVNGLEMPNANIGIRISIHDLSASGTIVFQETHAVTTNDFGLFTLSIGGGTAVSGSMSSVDWSIGSKYIEIEGDLTGGTNYVAFGTTELLSVPYSLYANNAGSYLLPDGTSNGNTPFWNGTNWVVSSDNIYNEGQFVGIGTNLPVQRLHVNGHINIPLDSAYMINNRKIVSAKGTSNIFVGNNAGAVNTIGFTNAFMGYNSGALNSVGSQNTFLGAESGNANIDGSMNSFLGRRAGFSNTNGNENTFLGCYAGQSNTEGQHNSFFGVTTGNSNTLGEENTFLGAHAGYFNNLGSYNVFVGNFSALANTSGNYNTVIGFEADVTTGNLTNVTVIGSGAIGSASNSVLIGNTDVTSIGGQVGWSTFSDRRLKSKIESSNLGLDFIMELQPVNYEYKADGQKGIIYTGLIAQDVEKVLTKYGTTFSGLVLPQNKDDHYSIRYAEFVMPLINAVQEQQEQIKELKTENDELRKKLDEIDQKLEKLANAKKN